MPKKQAKSFTSILEQPEGDVKALMDRLTKIQTVNACLGEFFSPTLALHCRAVNIRKGTLVIAVDSGTWLNKARFQMEELLSFLRHKGYISLANIDLIVQPK